MTNNTFDKFINNQKFKQVLLITLLLIDIFYFATGVLDYIRKGRDGFLRWQESAYLLNGINPFDIIKGVVHPLAEIGKIAPEAGTVPWAYFLSNAILPGFLPWEIAKGVGFVVYILGILFMCFVIYKSMKKLTNDKLIISILVCVSLSQYAWNMGLRNGNHSLTVAALLIAVSLLNSDKYPYLIGILLSFAMIKPQVAFLFFIPFLVKKQYKSVFTSILIVSMSWIASSILIHRNPLSMLSDIYNQGIDFEKTVDLIYYGLFDPLVRWGIPSKLVMPIEMVIGVLLVVYLSYKFKDAPKYILFTIPAVFSTVWMYNHTYDLAVMGLLSICSILLLYTFKTNSFEKVTIIILNILIMIPIIQKFYDYSIIVPLVQRLIYLAGLYVILSIYKRNTVSINEKQISTNTKFYGREENAI